MTCRSQLELDDVNVLQLVGRWHGAVFSSFVDLRTGGEVEKIADQSTRSGSIEDGVVSFENLGPLNGVPVRIQTFPAGLR